MKGKLTNLTGRRKTNTTRKHEPKSYKLLANKTGLRSNHNKPEQSQLVPHIDKNVRQRKGKKSKQTKIRNENYTNSVNKSNMESEMDTRL